MTVYSWRRPSAARIAAVLDGARAEQPAYPGRGGTARGEHPAGYRHAVQSRHVGHGDAVMARAAMALDSWAAPHGIGATITPSGARPVLGETVVQCIRLGPLWVLAACRVVWRVDEADRVGFAYGSLSAHPVRGEEAFVVSRDPAGVVRVRITVFSRAGTWPTRLAGPVGWWLQKRTARRYLAAIARA